MRILRKLAMSPNEAITTQDLIEFAWWPEYEGIPKGELYKCIGRIRAKLESSDRDPKFILTVHGYGYMLCPCKIEK
ncbi:helix-turn-helix domain-containing protein [Paenibacillus sp. 481]|nr:helix-turn-helix domain-containing protein [Paenibacillus sp. 481]